MGEEHRRLDDMPVSEAGWYEHMREQEQEARARVYAILAKPWWRRRGLLRAEAEWDAIRERMGRG
jgi:hypothetical protein